MYCLPCLLLSLKCIRLVTAELVEVLHGLPVGRSTENADPFSAVYKLLFCKGKTVCYCLRESIIKAGKIDHEFYIGIVHFLFAHAVNGAVLIDRMIDRPDHREKYNTFHFQLQRPETPYFITFFIFFEDGHRYTALYIAYLAVAHFVGNAELECFSFFERGNDGHIAVQDAYFGPRETPVKQSCCDC